MNEIVWDFVHSFTAVIVVVVVVMAVVAVVAVIVVVVVVIGVVVVGVVIVVLLGLFLLRPSSSTARPVDDVARAFDAAIGRFFRRHGGHPSRNGSQSDRPGITRRGVHGGD